MDQTEKKLKIAAEIEKMFCPGDELTSILQHYQSVEAELDLFDLELVSAAGQMDYASFLKMVESSKDSK